MIGKWPNTYTFTKAIAEGIVAEESNNLPLCIYRPSIGKKFSAIIRQIFLIRKIIFIAPSLKIRFSVPVERVETTIFNPRVESRCSTRSTVTANQILKRVATKNIIHYSKQNTAKAFRVIAALVSLGQQTSDSCNRSVSPLVM